MRLWAVPEEWPVGVPFRVSNRWHTGASRPPRHKLMLRTGIRGVGRGLPHQRRGRPGGAPGGGIGRRACRQRLLRSDTVSAFTSFFFIRLRSPQGQGPSMGLKQGGALPWSLLTLLCLSSSRISSFRCLISSISSGRAQCQKATTSHHASSHLVMRRPPDLCICICIYICIFIWAVVHIKFHTSHVRGRCRGHGGHC